MTETLYRPSRHSSPLCRPDVPLSSWLTGRKNKTKTRKQTNKNKISEIFFKGDQISPSCVQDVVGRAHQSHAEALDARCGSSSRFDLVKASLVKLPCGQYQQRIEAFRSAVPPPPPPHSPPPPPPGGRERERDVRTR